MSDMSTVESSVAKIIAEVLGEEHADIPRDAPLATLGWDSLNSMEALVILEREFAINLDLRSFHAAYTVAEMAALVEKFRSGATHTQ